MIIFFQLLLYSNSLIFSLWILCLSSNAPKVFWFFTVRDNQVTEADQSDPLQSTSDPSLKRS